MNILLVEDCPKFAAGIHRQLVADGHSVQTVSDRSPAVLRGAADGFDAVIVDKMVIDLGHSGAVEAIRAQCPYAPIVVLNGAVPEDETFAYAQDCGDYYVRSPDLSGLLDKLSVFSAGPTYVFEASSAA